MDDLPGELLKHSIGEGLAGDRLQLHQVTMTASEMVVNWYDQLIL